MARLGRVGIPAHAQANLAFLPLPLQMAKALLFSLITLVLWAFDYSSELVHFIFRSLYCLASIPFSSHVGALTAGGRGLSPKGSCNI